MNKLISWTAMISLALFAVVIATTLANASVVGALVSAGTEKGLLTRVLHGCGRSYPARCAPRPRCPREQVAVCMSSVFNKCTHRYSCCTSWRCSGGPF